eukprot:1161859-Pelagomonas_calceolata.AAC.7
MSIGGWNAAGKESFATWHRCDRHGIDAMILRRRGGLQEDGQSIGDTAFARSAQICLQTLPGVLRPFKIPVQRLKGKVSKPFALRDTEIRTCAHTHTHTYTHTHTATVMRREGATMVGMRATLTMMPQSTPPPHPERIAGLQHARSREGLPLGRVAGLGALELLEQVRAFVMLTK